VRAGAVELDGAQVEIGETEICAETGDPRIRDAQVAGLVRSAAVVAADGKRQRAAVLQSKPVELQQ